MTSYVTTSCCHMVTVTEMMAKTIMVDKSMELFAETPHITNRDRTIP